MTYVVLKRYLSDPISFDRLCKARGWFLFNLATGYTEKTVLLVISVSPFFRAELLAPVLHFVSVVFFRGL